jgi:hypothetical protein
VALALLAALGCAGNAWDQALVVDTPQAYHQFIRSYPDSQNVADAEERIEFHQVKRRPSLRKYEEFRKQYPDSALLRELRPLIEGQAFDASRAQGTPAAYHAFVDTFPGGAYASRALGNAAYLEANGFAGKPRELKDFADEHPDSDFAAEARRTVQGLNARVGTRFRHVGLVIDISKETPEAARLRRAFTERAMDTYEDSGIKLIPIPAAAPPNAPTMRLTIVHGEGMEKASMATDEVSQRAGVVARTTVTLSRGPESEPIFERTFVERLDAQEHIARASMLFASKQAKRYWDQFFVPVATWQSSAAVRAPFELEKKATAVDAVLGRAVVLFSDGDFQLMGLEDPENPVVLSRYNRKSKLEHFDGVQIVGDKVVLFGQDGLELVSFTPSGPSVTSHSRGEVGSIAALVPAEEGLLLASSKGLLLADHDGNNAERIMRRIARGLDAMGKTLVFTDGESVYVSTLALLRQNRVIAQLRLGREFKADRVRVVDSSAIVLGRSGIVIVDLSNAKKPRIASKMVRRVSGPVHDVVRVGDRVSLLGSRGMQLLDSGGTRIVEAVDVEPRERIARSGRHVVMIGENQLQVVDGLPFSSKIRPASRSKAR